MVSTVEREAQLIDRFMAMVDQDTIVDLNEHNDLVFAALQSALVESPDDDDDKVLYRATYILLTEIERPQLWSVDPDKTGVMTQYEDASVYVRRSQRYLDGTLYKFFDLAGVARASRNDNAHYDAKQQSTGFMRRLMDVIEQKAIADDGVFIENVINEFLPDWFRSRGYVEMVNMYPPCFYWLRQRDDQE